jgi:membrane associated rhomboid family serine protease
MNSKSFPYITVALLLANVIVQALVVLNAHEPYPDLMYRFGAFVYPSDLTQGHWWRLITAAFIHGGWMHFLANMSNFVFFPYAEKAVGHWRFLLIYMLSCVGSSLLTFLLWSMFHLHPGISMVMGASGGITGVLGAFVAFSFLVGQIKGEAKAQSMIPGMLVLLGFQIYNDMTNLEGGLGSLWFHLFGFVIGFSLSYALLALALRKMEGLKPRTNPLTYVWAAILLLAIGMSVYDKNRLQPLNTLDEVAASYYANLAGDEQESFRRLQVSAQLGHPQAQSVLGNLYATGAYGGQNFPKAIYWWEKAACQGNLAAAMRLAHYYETKSDWASALRWRRTALNAAENASQRTALLQDIQELKSKR